MSTDFDKDDLARLIALEHAFCAVTLISASNYAALAGEKPSDAVRRFREAIEGSIYDGQHPPELRSMMRKHLKRIFDHIAATAMHADLGVPSEKG